MCVCGGVNCHAVVSSSGRYEPAVCFNENHEGGWHSDGVCGSMTMGMTAGAANWPPPGHGANGSASSSSGSGGSGGNRQPAFSSQQAAGAVVHTMMGQPAWGNCE